MRKINEKQQQRGLKEKVAENSYPLDKKKNEPSAVLYKFFQVVDNYLNQ